MAKVYDCGGIGSHIGDCDCRDAPWNKTGKRANTRSSVRVPKASKGHTHNYVNVGRPWTGQDDNDLIMYQKKHCQNAGCNAPDYIEEVRTPRTRPSKNHQHQWGTAPSRTWTRRGKMYMEYSCQVKGCPAKHQTHT